MTNTFLFYIKGVKMANINEMIDIYDDDRKFTGVTLPRKTRLEKGQYMLYVLALIQNDDGKFLVTQRAMDKKWAAGQWEIPGGGSMAGETSLDALKREVYEETGLDISSDNISVIYSYKNYDEKYGDNYFADIYLVKKSFSLEDVNLDAREVTNMKLASLEEIDSLHNTDGFLHYKRIHEALDQI